MKRVFETAECEEISYSISSVQRYEKHENQIEGCGVELKVSGRGARGPRGLVIL